MCSRLSRSRVPTTVCPNDNGDATTGDGDGDGDGDPAGDGDGDGDRDGDGDGDGDPLCPEIPVEDGPICGIDECTGGTVWSRRFGNSMQIRNQVETIQDIATDPDGNIYIAGIVQGSIDFGNLGNFQLASGGSWPSSTPPASRFG